MTAVICICLLSCVGMILGILFKPRLSVGCISVDSYWVAALIGALAVLVSGRLSLSGVWGAMTADTAINPLKILVLFLSMTVLSIFLDELGFFSYMANVVLSRAKTSQMKLFLYLYITVSVLTVFTSNDIIILSFTPFICYFAKRAKISPVPYLAAEFIAANTWSMALIIGNPTNVYLATSYGVDFAAYARIMALPTLGSGIVAFLALLLRYGKSLRLPMQPRPEHTELHDKLLLAVGLCHLIVCTVLLAVSSYVGLDMWLVSLLCALSLFLWVIVISLLRRRPPVQFVHCIRRAPWSLVPFVLSMFVMIMALDAVGVTEHFTRWLGQTHTVLSYGLSSFLAANVINNIPMSVLFCALCSRLPADCQLPAVFASVIGSNLGALLTPIGALAGIMWSNTLKRFDIRFEYADFLKMGLTVALPTLAAALLLLRLIIE